MAEQRRQVCRGVKIPGPLSGNRNISGIGLFTLRPLVFRIRAFGIVVCLEISSYQGRPSLGNRQGQAGCPITSRGNREKQRPVFLATIRIRVWVRLGAKPELIMAKEVEQLPAFRGWGGFRLGERRGGV